MSTLRVNSGTIIASPTWEPTGLLQDQVLTLSGLFYSPVAFGTPYRFSLPAGRNGPSLRAIAHSLIDLGAVAALVRRQSHHRVMDRSIDRQHAIDRLFHPLATRDQTRPCYRSSHISFQLASAPMRIFARGVKLANVGAVQRPHDADTRKHRRAARRRYKDQGLHCGLPLRGGLVFSLWKSRDVFAGVRERDKLATARQRYRFIKASFPAPDQPPASIGTRRRFMVISIF